MVRMICINYANEANLGSAPRCLLSISCLQTNGKPVATAVLALLRIILTTDVIGCLQMRPLDLVFKENNKLNATGL